jgi:hypothetical protein
VEVWRPARSIRAEVDPGSLFPIGGRLLTRQIERTLKKDVATLARNIDAL